jgi:hypothetical protein
LSPGRRSFPRFHVRLLASIDESLPPCFDGTEESTHSLLIVNNMHADDPDH